jgi:transcriptional regulator with XRE-family HTH domain
MPKPSKIAVISYAEIGGRVRALRQRQGLTQVALAKTLGTTQAAVSSVERGGRGLTVQQVVKLARALKATPNEILGERNGRAPRPTTTRLARRVHRLEALPEPHQTAVLRVLDELLRAHQRAR